MRQLSVIILFCLALWASTAAAITLTPTEKLWLQQHPTLRLGIDASWPPFEFRDEQGKYRGLAASYITHIEQTLKVKVKPIEPREWSAVLTLAKAGDIDLLPGIMSTPERQTYLAFTRPYLDFPIVILARKDGPQPRNLKALYGLKVAVVKDYAPHELLRDNNPDLNLLPLPSVDAALQALSTGRADALVGDLASSVWRLRQLKLEGVSISGETPYRYQLAMATPSKNHVLVGILDKVFDDMSSEQIDELQEPWIGGVIDSRDHWRELLIYGLPFLVALLAILLSVVISNRRLNSEASRRRLVEQELRTSEHHYRGLVENLSAITWESTADSFCYTYVSSHAEKLLGYPLDNWKKSGFWQSILHPEDAAETISFTTTETAAGRDHSLDYRMLAKDGHIVWVRDIVTLSQQNDRLTLRGLMIDISEAKGTEQALRLSKQKFISVFQQCPDIMVIADRKAGTLLEVNQAFEQQFAIRIDEAIGKTPHELNIWGEPDADRTFQKKMANGSLRNLELPFRRSSGELFTGLISAEALNHADNSTLVIVIRDISIIRSTQHLLELSEEKFAKAFHASPDGMLITRAEDGVLLDANEGFTHITGFNAKQVLNRSTLELGLWSNPKQRTYILQQLQSHGSIRDYTAAIRTSTGAVRICELSAQLMTIGNQACLLTIARDVTDRQVMQEKLLQAATVFESTAEGVMITDTNQHITAINRAFTEITGFSELETLGNHASMLSSGLHDRKFYTEMWQQLTRNGHWQGEIWNKRKTGELFPEWLTISAVRNSLNEITHYVGVFADITPLKQAQAKLDHQAHHDSLTGLPNRLLFETRLQAELEKCHASDRHGAVLFMDLDRFKHINDSLGHPIGDQLLKSIAERLKLQLSEQDTVARLGGDEFIILLPELQTRDQAAKTAERLLACFNQAFIVEQHQFFISASIGLSLYPDDAQDVASLIKNADAAMYQSKAKGRNRLELYTPELTSIATERMNLEIGLRHALEHNQLHVVYQPKFSLNNNQLIGAEALVRWTHPELGEIQPSRFIPIAEECGLILPLGRWMLEQSCKQMANWQATHAPFGAIAVNLAGVQLRQPDLIEMITALLKRYNLAPDLLQLEITESFIMNQTEDALGTLHHLKDLGLQLAIDDFGTGYSSLSYLKRLPLDTLKIDQSFVRGLPQNPHDAAIARAIIALGKSLQLTVIAEGVETKAQAQFLAEAGCEQIQGFFINRPLDAKLFADKFLQPKRSVGMTRKAPV
ncbi:bifunctional diguanylate cyclase/phosphodiesterase [Pseudomonas sp. M30-35]|uniref:bifunctional diguanylate cyclase/phosphodiesterase n=1 Tax=Pseudomonas sp. M30-35 TaxID=1981174 RepID=UPI000B3C3768|nr:EAL domain-containing protein [Pseudomonas sp. M30-35]ARU86987.1 bifunctional diguanylate cyclase/phosphodiesterase [Pseudomonas sp. M30-35]